MAGAPGPVSVPPPLEGRECGACNVCCVALTIDDPALRKVQGVRCPNAQADNGCAIYDSRPRTCRSFLCGWRLLRWVRPGLRPHESGVLVRLGVRTVGGRRQDTVIVTLLREAGLEAEGVAETVAAPVRAGLAVFLEIAGPPGRTYGTARVDEALADVVRRGAKAEMLAMLRGFWAQGRAQAGLSRAVGGPAAGG